MQVTDVLPAGVAYKSASSSQGTLTVNGSTITAQLGNLAAGATATVTIQVDVAPTTRGTITNTAEVRGNETESNPDNNRDDEPTVVRAEVDLEVTKTDSPDPVVAGRQLVYTVLVKNNGPSTATNVQLTDTLPPQVQFVSATTTQGSVSHASGVMTGTLGTVPVGGTVTVTLTTRVAEATVGTITNRAEVNAAETESNPDNNRDDEPTLVRAEVDLVVSKTDSPDPVTAGQPLVYTVVVANNGPSTATNVQLTDTLPPEVEFVSATTTQGSVSHAAGVVTGALGSVPVGGSVTVTVTTRVAANAAGTITNRAVVSSPETESNPDNNRDDEPTQVHELLSSIAGYVYVDANDDGLMNPGELPLAGVTVLLTGTDARGRSASQQAVTGSDGSYRFEGLSGGTYKLTQVQPAGYEDGRDTPGSLGGNASRNDELSDIPVPAGAAATDYLFGERSGTFSKRRFLSSRRAM